MSQCKTSDKNIWTIPMGLFTERIKMKLPKATIPDGQVWRMDLLSRLLENRQNLIASKEDLSTTKIWIDSLCST